MQVVNQFGLRSLLAAMLLGLVPMVQAATLEVSWQDIANYRDIRAVNEPQKRFEQHVTSALAEHLTQLAAQLPADHVLRITVTDLDLAGRVEPMFSDTFQTTRVLNRIDYPMIHFNYDYSDGSGAVLQSGEERLKDMGQLESRRTMMASGRDQFFHEKRLLDDWFKQAFTK